MFFFACATMALLKLFSEKKNICSRIYVKIHKTIFFNFLIRTFIESYLEFCTSAMTATLNLDFNSVANSVNAVLTIIFFVIAVLFPPFSLWFLVKYQQKLQ